MAENAAGATIAAVTTANATSTSVDNDDFEVVGGNLKLKDGVSLDFEAADGGGLSDMFSFELAVAFSGAGNQDNDGPDLSRGTSRDVNENPGADVVVATFTVSDDNSGLTGHPFAPGSPMITNVVNADDNNDSNNGAGYRAAFDVKPAGGNSYQIVTTAAAKNLLDHETVDDLTITVRVEDGAGASDTLDISVDIRDVNEAPDKQAAGNLPAGGTAYVGPGNAAISVEQEEAAKEYLWIKLFDFWNDPDADDDDNDLTFTASSNVPWIKVLHEPQPWEGIKDGPDGDSGTADDITWGTIGTVASSNVGNAPTDEDYVVVIEIDRTMANNKQADVAAGGTITLTARDKGGMTGTETIKVNITDENLGIGANAVILTGSVREGGTLRAVFDEAKDPDLAGDLEAYQVVYAWYASNNANGSGGEVRQKGLSDRYTMTQEDVGKYIRVDVTYRELEPPTSGTVDFTNNAQDAGSAVASGGMVRNTPDRGVVHFNIQANANDNGLTAQVRIVDEDGVPAAGANGAPEYIWQSSPNGITGWDDVPLADDGDRTDQALSLADGDGDHYRLKVMYTDEGGVRELHFSQAVRVGDLSAPSSPPTLSGAGAVGGTLRVNNAGDGARVQWQKQMGTDVGGNPFWVDIAGATGATLGITKEYAGATVRAVVTYSGAEGNIVTFAISAADGGGGTPAVATVGIRLNVKPTDIMVNRSSSFTVTEGKMVSGDMTVATLNVQDENLPSHEYGTHTVTVDDDRFKVVEDNDGDGSTWKLQVKEGSVFDYKEGASNQNVMVTLAATDGGGLSVKRMNIPLTALVIQNDPADSVPDNEVPGLDDNEASDSNDKTDGTDVGNDDNDGGWTPPPPGMSLGIGLIEDFVSNADGFDQNLFEDFMLVIDDGIDIA